MNTLHRRALLALVALCGLSAGSAWSQTFPTKPIRMVVGYSPGGATDQIIHLIGPHLTRAWGQQVIMDHRAGASGSLSAQLVARAAPDGHTLLMCNSTTFSSNAALNPSLPYDPLKDFTGITPAVIFPTMLVVHPSVPVNTIQELIAYAKTRPGALNYASAGTGSSAHIAAELFNLRANTKMTHVPYKGTGLAINDVVAGQVQLMFMNVAPAMPLLKSGKLKALGVTSATRTAAAPQIPTVAESGLPGFEIAVWIGFCAPSGVPRDIIVKLNGELTKALNNPQVKETLQGAGSDVVTMSPEDMQVFLRKDLELWARVVKSANIKAE